MNQFRAPIAHLIISERVDAAIDRRDGMLDSPQQCIGQMV